MSPRPPSDVIYTGDALGILRGWPAVFVDVVVTDPPYGNNTSYGHARTRIAGDENPLVGLLGISACYRLLKPNSTLYSFCDARHLGLIEHFVLRYTQYSIRDVLVWDKMRIAFGHGFRRRHECIVVLEKGHPKYRDLSIPNVLCYPRPSTAHHPHAKPIELLGRLIETSTDEGDLVLDPFAGSGSTLVAAQRSGRHFLGIELDGEYAAVARRRMEAEAGGRPPVCSDGVFGSSSDRRTRSRPTCGRNGPDREQGFPSGSKGST